MPPNIHWRDMDSSDSSMASRRSGSDSDKSYQSQYTSDTKYSPTGSDDKSYQLRRCSQAEYPTRPALRNAATCNARLEGTWQDYYNQIEVYEDPQSSTESYPSTVASEEDLPELEPEEEYHVPDYGHLEAFPTDAIPATPADFAELFPSSRKLSIKHDDATLDGNMNLRVDTRVVLGSGRRRNITLFHLRMHDLKNREFSFRRYCRDSGREICHSVRRYQSPATEMRPGLSRSLSNALASLIPKSESKSKLASNLKRQDSGYASMHSRCDEDEDEDAEDRPTSSHGSKGVQRSHSLPTNTVKLEFSNYAQVDVKRRGAKKGKRYEFEYWGFSYRWKRVARKDGACTEISYHLFRNDSDKAMAHIVPVPLTRLQQDEEDDKGGWIPPCTMWLSDNRINNGVEDISDIIVATGLIALVDDCIKRRFHSTQARQVLLPKVMKLPFGNLESIGPKKLINETFNRSGRGTTSSRYPTPLRHAQR